MKNEQRNTIKNSWRIKNTKILNNKSKNARKS